MLHRKEKSMDNEIVKLKKEDAIELTPNHINLARGMLQEAAKNHQYARQLKDEFLMILDGDHEASNMSLVISSLEFCLRRGLANPKGNIAKLMKKSGFDSPEVLRGTDFDFTPEQ
jgi:hypothetical protein